MGRERGRKREKEGDEILEQNVYYFSRKTNIDLYNPDL